MILLMMNIMYIEV